MDDLLSSSSSCLNACPVLQPLAHHAQQHIVNHVDEMFELFHLLNDDGADDKINHYATPGTTSPAQSISPTSDMCMRAAKRQRAVSPINLGDVRHACCEQSAAGTSFTAASTSATTAVSAVSAAAATAAATTAAATTTTTTTTTTKNNNNTTTKGATTSTADPPAVLSSSIKHVATIFADMRYAIYAGPRTPKRAAILAKWKHIRATRVSIANINATRCAAKAHAAKRKQRTDGRFIAEADDEGTSSTCRVSKCNSYVDL